MKTSRQSLWPLLALLFGMTSIQSSAVLARQLFAQVGPQGTLALRVLLAALVLLVVVRPWRFAVPAAARPWIVAYGLSLSMLNYLFYLALERVPLGVAVTLEFTGPLAVAIAASRRPSDFLWAALATTGVLLLSPLGALHDPLDALGVLYGLGAGMAWAGYIVFGQRAGRRMAGSSVTTLGMLVSALVVVPLGVAQSSESLWRPSLLPTALALAILGSALPYPLEMIALRRMSARAYGIFTSLEPAIAALAGLWFMAEHLSARQWTAVGCVMLASVGASLGGGLHAEALPAAESA